MGIEKVLRAPARMAERNIMPFLNKQYYVPSAAATPDKIATVEPVEVTPAIIDSELPMEPEKVPPLTPPEPFKQVIPPKVRDYEIQTMGELTVPKYGFSTMPSLRYDFGTDIGVITGVTPAVHPVVSSQEALRDTTRYLPFEVAKPVPPVEDAMALRPTFRPPWAVVPWLPTPSRGKRRRDRKAPKRKKKKIWWDVPEQPLGEAYSPYEYVVFTGGEPAKVARKEKGKKLDSILDFDFKS